MGRYWIFKKLLDGHISCEIHNLVSRTPHGVSYVIYSNPTSRNTSLMHFKELVTCLLTTARIVRQTNSAMSAT